MAITVQLGSGGNTEGNGNGSNNKVSGSKRIRVSSQAIRSGSGESKGSEKSSEGDSEQSSKPRKRLIDIHELSQWTKVCVNTIYSWVSQRRIPFIKMGRLLRFDVEKITEWLVQNEVKPMEI